MDTSTNGGDFSLALALLEDVEASASTETGSNEGTPAENSLRAAALRLWYTSVPRDQETSVGIAWGFP